MLSPIQTLRHYVHSVEFTPISEVDETAEDVLDILLKSHERDDCWQVILGVKFGNVEGKSSIPYKGKIEVKGAFEVAKSFPKEKTEDLVNMNGGAILYGAVRELVTLLSSRSQEGAFELPTLDARCFFDIAKHSKKQALEEKEGNSSSSINLS